MISHKGASLLLKLQNSAAEKTSTVKVLKIIERNSDKLTLRFLFKDDFFQLRKKYVAFCFSYIS